MLIVQAPATALLIIPIFQLSLINHFAVIIVQKTFKFPVIILITWAQNSDCLETKSSSHQKYIKKTP